MNFLLDLLFQAEPKPVRPPPLKAPLAPPTHGVTLPQLKDAIQKLRSVPPAKKTKLIRVRRRKEKQL